jgi:leucyl-tRNA synthetase
VFRFLQRTWRLIVDEDSGKASSFVQDGDGDPALERLLHKTIKKVTDDLERMAFNTAISAMMEFVNEAYRAKRIARGQVERFMLLLSPFAPHLAEELWQRLRGSAWKTSLAYEPWPTYDAAVVVDAEVEVPVQINGKVAGRVVVPRDADEAAVRTAALADARVIERLAGADVMKSIYVPGRMLNLVVRK